MVKTRAFTAAPQTTLGDWMQVINALSDLRSGKLSRIWMRRPLPQLLMALEEAILCLPASRLRTQYLQSAALGLQYLADDGVACPCVVCQMGLHLWQGDVGGLSFLFQCP